MRLTLYPASDQGPQNVEVVTHAEEWKHKPHSIGNDEQKHGISPSCVVKVTVCALAERSVLELVEHCFPECHRVHYECKQQPRRLTEKQLQKYD
jgi:hypothetical protein